VYVLHLLYNLIKFYFISIMKKCVYISLISNCRKKFKPDGVTRDIVESIMRHMSGPVIKWKHYPMEVRNVLFQDFTVRMKFFIYILSFDVFIRIFIFIIHYIYLNFVTAEVSF